MSDKLLTPETAEKILREAKNCGIAKPYNETTADILEKLRGDLMINQVPKDTVIEIANMVHFDVFGEDIQNIQGEMCRGLDERLKNRPAEYITVDTEYSVIEKPLIKQLSAQPIIEQVPSKPRIGLKQKITDKLKNLLGKV